MNEIRLPNQTVPIVATLAVDEPVLTHAPIRYAMVDSVSSTE
ncbi:MAG: hypothetical protein V1913_10925 [Fibrobacterota bacterium]